MSIDSESTSSTQLLSSSQSSLNRSSKRSSSEISKIYKHASQLFLTRRLVEAYEALKPVVTPSGQARPDDSPAQAPIATATTSQRIKIWSLYVTLLNSIIDLGLEEGKEQFGEKVYKGIVRTVQSGDIWEQVVRDGYQGREGSVDAEVVYNLSNLLLGQAPDQKVNQARLETYLSSSSPSSSSQLDLDLSAHLSNNNAGSGNGRRSGMDGTNTPKDLTSRIKIIEIFTLHVLPRNGEWDYARSVLTNSDILDEERREAFLQTLQELQDVSEREKLGQAELDIFEDTEEGMPEFTASGTGHGDDEDSRTRSGKPTSSRHQRTSSEVDYGIEKEHPSGSYSSSQSSVSSVSSTPDQKTQTQTQPAPLNKLPPQPMPTARSPPLPSGAGPKGRNNQLSPPAQTPRPGRPTRKPKAPTQNGLIRQARQLFLALTNLARNMAGAVSNNPTTLLRLLLFILAFVMAFSQRQIRERAKRLLDTSWQKIRGTVGMGVKVSYI
ncbi:hypothetical protein ABEF92_007347 [Exophiala dermatitidis]|uniref:Peroxin 26 n=1 Tax=Exophiala dermatitidis (strain ATCC 34100 / CBS 525.76 / NIH/UT8656) TaxID=858893 RepID=H6BZV9_EXODN|nr:uncharacterized protein HMPREF1120_04380 [Exophiala dermatitidis NIH/UT8656]EHY56294.1 hypothetical protein HMPREF1120_04380 [Exophiala dermatitidis NIH/UT8656]